MISRTLAIAAALGSAALSAAVLFSPISAAAPSASLPSVGPTVSPTVSPTASPSPTTPPPTVKHGWYHGHRTTTFALERAAGVVRAGCLPYAKASVTVIAKGDVEVMKVRAAGLPRHTEFDFFVLQVPDFPFGLSWYQGDLSTDRYGRAEATFVGRFNEETFSLAPGAAPAPVLHESPTADASTNPVTPPVHQHHLGFWFGSAADADRAGCGATVTPFNGEHDAGTQAMSTRQFPAEAGPLGRVKS